MILGNKDRLLSGDHVGVIYSENCLDCSAVYCGMTLRSHKTRHNEHMKRKNKNSEMAVHMEILGHKFDDDKLTVLDRENNWSKARISEFLYIHMLNNTINIHSHSLPFNDIYKELTQLFHY